MSKILIGTVLLATAASASLQVSEDLAFQGFVHTHTKQYSSAAEASMRKRVFISNLRKAATMQAANPKATFGITQFSDLTQEEFQAYHNGAEFFRRAKADRKAKGAVANLYSAKQLTTGVKDWRAENKVTSVKNQGSCGSCWAFSAVAEIESAWAIAGNPLTELSEQQLVACDTTDSGCDGGLMDDAFAWLLSNTQGEIATLASYPYASGSGYSPSCKSTGLVTGAKISGHANLPQDEAQMGAFVLNQGVLSVAVDATSFQFYTGGIMTNCVSRQIDHGVTIVGVDDNNIPPYWIVKNSWGSSWGEQGYIRIQKGTNQCLINELVSYVKI